MYVTFVVIFNGGNTMIGSRVGAATGAAVTYSNATGACDTVTGAGVGADVKQAGTGTFQRHSTPGP
jgi:hypothetical protein